MTSFRMPIDARKRKAARFIGAVRRELQRAYVDEQKAARRRGVRLTQAAIAKRLGIHRSVVNRSLVGTGDLTLRTIADLAWALDRDIVFRLEEATDPVPEGRNEPAGGDRAATCAFPSVQVLQVDAASAAVPAPAAMVRFG